MSFSQLTKSRLGAFDKCDPRNVAMHAKSPQNRHASTNYRNVAPLHICGRGSN